MTSKRRPSIKERRAISAIVDALRTGSLRSSDLQGTIELLVSTFPDMARLPQHALHHLAASSLRHAVNVVSSHDSNHGVPPPQSTSLALKSVPKATESPSRPSANSNDLLPSTRSPTPLPTLRKRRRTSHVFPQSSDPSGVSQSFVVPRPSYRFHDIGGLSSILDTMRELVEWPLSRRHLYNRLGVDPPRGILLHGPPGCGKTLLAHAVAGELNVPFLRLSAPEIVSGVSGDSERKLRLVFAQAVRLQPSIIFIDEIDAIASRREGATKDMERRIVSQLLTCIDDLSTPKEPSISRKNVTPEDDHLRDNGQPAPTPTNQSSDPETVLGDAGSSTQPVADTSASASASADADAPTEATRAINDDGNGSTIDPLPAVVVIAATNRPESLEPALRRAGRFDKEIELGAPDEDGRRAILAKLFQRLRLDASVDVTILAKRTAGYVGADLHLLVKEAGLACIRRIVELEDNRGEDESNDIEMRDDDEAAGESNSESDVEEGLALEESGFVQGEGGNRGGMVDLGCEDSVERRMDTKHVESSDECIKMKDFEKGLEGIQPSALREGFATRPNVSWENVGSLESVREEMMMAIVQPIRRPEIFQSLGLSAAGGVLLYGPPGCGKTLLARAVASESGANFISVKGPELLSRYVGDSELAVRKVFSRARSSAPCVIFFDEMDALAPRRTGGGGGESSGASERVVNMLLTEMDGFNERQQVFLIAATNRPDIIDAAMLRPGRLDKLVYVGLPDGCGRASILETLLKGVRVGEDVDVKEISQDVRSEGFSGADLKALIRVAGERALKARLATGDICDTMNIGKEHFDKALDIVLPSVSPRDAGRYESMRKKLRKSTREVLPESLSDKLPA